MAPDSAASHIRRARALCAVVVSLLGQPATPATPAAPAAAAGACAGIRHEIVTVRADRGEWTSARLGIKPNDVILVSANGRITVGRDGTRTVGAKGLPDGRGALEMKVGTGTVVPAGSHWFGSFPDYGTLMFRIAANHREDLAGSYQVNLVVIAAESLPETVTLDPDQ